MSLSDALAADRHGDLEEAAELYERAIASGESSLRALLNLALLYWQATDVGMASAKNLRPDFLMTAGRRSAELLVQAARQFPESSEPQFWKRYIAWADLGEPFDADECRELLRKDRFSLIPAMHLFAATAGTEARTQAHELLRQCQEDGTTAARYVVSVIDGVINRLSWSP